MYKNMRRLPVRARRNPDCRVPINILPPSAIIVPLSVVALGALASLLRNRGLTADGQEVARFPEQEVKRLLGGEAAMASIFLRDEKAVLKAASSLFPYKDADTEPEAAFTRVEDPAVLDYVYRQVGLSNAKARPPVYIAPVGDVETLYQITNRRADRNVFASGRLPSALNMLLRKAPKDTWGVAVLLPEEVVIAEKKDDPPSPLYNREEFIRELHPPLVWQARGPAGELALRTRAQRLVQALYPDLSDTDKGSYADELMKSCVYRVYTAQDEPRAVYMDQAFVGLVRKDFLPAQFVSRFIDVAVATIFLRPKLNEMLRDSQGRGVGRGAVEVAVRAYRQRHKLLTLDDLRTLAEKSPAEQDLTPATALSEEDLATLLARINEAEGLLTVPRLARLEKDPVKGSPRAQVNELVGRLPSFYVPNAFAARVGRLPAQRSNVAVTHYAHGWSMSGLDSVTMTQKLAVPQMFTVVADTLAEAAEELDDLRERLKEARDVLIDRVGADVFKDWSEASELRPLTICAVVLSANPSSWPKPARGTLGRGAELRSLGGAEKNGKLVLFSGVQLHVPAGKQAEVVVTPAELSERDVNLIFRNYVPFTVQETMPGEFSFVKGSSAALALAPEVLVFNERVQQTVERMNEDAEERAAKKKSKAEEKRARRNPQAQSTGSVPGLLGSVGASGTKTQTARGPETQGEPVEISDIEWLAINSYLHDIAPTEEPFRRTPAEIARRKAGAALTGAGVAGARRAQSEGFVATRRLSKFEVAARMRAQSIGWWPNLTRIVLDNVSDPIAFTEVSNQKAKDNLIERALALYGVSYDPSGPPERQHAALMELRNLLVLDEMPSELERDAYIPARLRPPSAPKDMQLEDGPEDEDAISETLIAQLNPRRRAPRAPRRPRPARLNLRRNPLSSDYADKVKSGFSREQDFTREGENEEVDYTVTRRAFPDVFSTRNDVKPEAAAARIAEHGQYVRFGRRPVLDDYAFGTAPPPSQGGLSLEEARGIHKRQVEAYERRTKSSIPASSALCAVNRRQKLKGYRPPAPLMQFGQPGFAEKKVVIWVSPTSASDTRVMMYRRNTHIDCDFVASPGGMSLGQLLALALQDVLLWLAQRDARKLDTYVYVGRIGEGKMRLAWKPGDPLTYSAMLKNLGGDGVTLPGYNSAEDTDRYLRAAQLSYVSAVASAQREAARATEPKEDDAPLETPPETRPTTPPPPPPPPPQQARPAAPPAAARAAAKEVKAEEKKAARATGGGGGGRRGQQTQPQPEPEPELEPQSEPQSSQAQTAPAGAGDLLDDLDGPLGD